MVVGLVIHLSGLSVIGSSWCMPCNTCGCGVPFNTCVCSVNYSSGGVPCNTFLSGLSVKGSICGVPCNTCGCGWSLLLQA